MKNLITLTQDGLWWPKHDGGTAGPSMDNPNSCYYGLHARGAHDVPQKISNYVPKKQVVIQAGGNCGFYIRQYAEIFDTVYTFEPDAVNFYCLCLNVPHQNVYKFQACLGHSHKLVSTGTTPDMLDVGSTHVTGTGNTPTFRIDDLDLDICDLIQLDVEGYELNALKGAETTLKKCRPVLAIECFDAWAQRYDSSLAKINEYLKSLGYITTAYIETGCSTDIIYKYQD